MVKNWNTNYKLATALVFVLIVWMASGLVSNKKSHDKTPEKELASELFTVQVTSSRANSYKQAVFVRGRTEANRSVLVMAEIGGQVIQTSLEEGRLVRQGESLCKLDSQDRLLRLEQAQAEQAKAEIDYNGALTLKDKGLQSKTQIAAVKASLAVAEAELKASTLAVERLVIRAPFDGVIQEQLVDAGGFIERGSACARLIELTPLVVVGHVPETEIALLSINDEAEVRFLNGVSRVGKVRYISRAADLTTRTFKIEVELDNKSLELADGLSADMVIFTGETQAHLISPSLLVLMSENRVGVKIVDENNRVELVRVRLVGDALDGVWVAGLPDRVTLITVGQEYVSAGSPVTVVFNEDSPDSMLTIGVD